MTTQPQIRSRLKPLRIGSDEALSDLHFCLNGRAIRMREVDPAALLVDYLRSAQVGLTGTKIGCKQGGCGACTVLLSQFDAATRQVSHRSVNACMRPLASLDGMAVTTIEGMGSVNGAVSPVQYALAKNNGTQCGYCTPGMVMSAHGCLAARGLATLQFDTGTERVYPHDPGYDRLPSKAQLQQRLDGNICRCTGYRPILFGLQKGFARDWTAADAAGCMGCEIDPADPVAVSGTIAPEFPPALKVAPRALRFAGGGHTWDRPMSLANLKRLLRKYPVEAERKLVVGNTSVGVYDKYTEDPRHLIDIAHVAELRTVRVTERGLRVGAALSYNDFLDLLDVEMSAAQDQHPERIAGLAALRYLAGRTAGAIVRDAASLAGNTMLVLRHITDGVPFPSDLFTGLATVGARLRVWDGAQGRVLTRDLLDFATHYSRSAALRAQCLVLGYDIPFTPAHTYVQAYKTALREVNAHAIVNAGFCVRFDAAGRVAQARVVLGGVAPCAVAMETVQAALCGKPWTWATGAAAQTALNAELDELFACHAERYAGLPFEGFSNDYRRQLANAYLYKFFVEVAQSVNPEILTPDQLSAAARAERPVSAGTQTYAVCAAEAPVNVPYIKLDAFLQATGEAVYPQDLALPQRGLEAAYAFSTRALATFVYRLPGQRKPSTPAAVLKHLQQVFPGIVDYLGEADMPLAKGTRTNLQGLAKDQPVFAAKTPDGRAYQVLTDGQSLGLVLALDAQIARDAAHYVSHKLAAYTQSTPRVSIAQALQANSLFADFPSTASWMSHVWQVIRPGTQSGWFEQAGDGASGALNGMSCRFVTGRQAVGAQVHFYMETQTCLALPGEEGHMALRSSTQDADQVHGAVAGVLELPMNKVSVRVKRVGGAYGGKCNSPVFVAIAAALAARKHQCAVRLAVKREVDTAMFGHRHPAQGQFTVAIGDGSDTPSNKGKLLGLQNDFYLNGGWSYDCSFIVSDCLQLRADSAYYVPNYGTSSDVCRTNISSSTAFRTMGMIQGVLMQEEAIERAAHAIGMRPEDVRSKNLYAAGQQTPFGQVLHGCYIADVFAHTREKYRFNQRLKEVHAFNAKNRWRKRGLSLIPVKYGSGYNLPMLEQAGALIEVFDQDGTVLVRTGGVEMGQGLNTKIAQVAAFYLGVLPELVRVAELDTAVVPNPSCSGASTGSSFNAAAVAACAQDLCRRLIAFCAEHNRSDPPPPALLAHPEHPGQQWPGGAWAKAVSAAQWARFNLSSQQRVAIAGGTKLDNTGLYFHDAPPPNGKPSGQDELNYNFTGYTYSAAIAEVEIDVLTGETTVLQADIVYDMGLSQNPAVDVGQVEGAFVQGIGYVMYEELVYQPEGTPLAPGVLNSTNTWNYKPPAVTSIPLSMNVELYQHPGHGAAQRLHPVRSSKEVGEPPMTLAATVFFAIKHAVLAARQDSGHGEWFELEVPATVQRIAQACRAPSTS